MTATDPGIPVKGATLEPGSPEWLRTMTGSKAAAALGLSPYESAYELWRVMTGRAPAFRGNHRTLIGQHLEPEVLEDYGQRHGVELIGHQEEIRHPELNWLVHIDARRPDENVAVEAKTVAERPEDVAPGEQPRWFKPSNWGPHGSDQVPEYYLAQEVLQMACGGFDRVDLHAQFIRWNPEDCTGIKTEARTYQLHRNPALESRVIGKLQEFMWYVKNDKPPAPRDAGEAFRRQPTEPRKAVEMDAEMDDLITNHNRLQKKRAPIKDRLDGVESDIRAAKMRLFELAHDAAQIVDPAGEVIANIKDTKAGRKQLYLTPAGRAMGVRV